MLHHALPSDYGVEPRFRSAGGRPRVVFVGRSVAKKGLDTLIAASARLASKGARFSVHLYGEGEELPRLRQLVQESGLERFVHFEGPIPNEAFYSTVRPADRFISPSKYMSDGDRDGIPVTLLEAMAAGITVVSTRVSAIPELISDGVNLFLVPPADPAALTEVSRSTVVARNASAGDRRRGEPHDLRAVHAGERCRFLTVGSAEKCGFIRQRLAGVVEPVRAFLTCRRFTSMPGRCGAIRQTASRRARV